jgi:hypothetical protein
VHGYSPSNPSVAKPMGHHRGMQPGETTWDSVQRSSCLRLQLFSVETFLLFQSVKAMAAIFRAKVRRAISGFMPFSSKAT